MPGFFCFRVIAQTKAIRSYSMKSTSKFDQIISGKKPDYDTCIETLFSLGRFGIKPGLEIIRHLLKELGNPQKEFRSIHIAGTNGKGSTAAGIASILQASEIKTGLFTSPHLIRFNERIRIGDTQITDEEVVELYIRVKKADTGERPATFFEYATAMAFCYFADKKVEYAVIEAGMGGRLDSTNIITPCASIITNVSMDHESFLGSNIRQIAYDKSGIIKTGVPLITGSKNPEVLEIFETETRKNNSKLFILGRDFNFTKDQRASLEFIGIQKNAIDGLEINLSGDHQIENMALSIAACRMLKEPRINDSSIKKGASNVLWPGRLEHINKNPDIILDGAHNPDAAEKLSKHLQEYHNGNKICLIIGMMKDKDQSETLKFFSEIASRVIATESKSPRAEKAENIDAIFKKEFGVPSIPIPDIGEAIEYAVNSATIDEMICITGSLYIVGEAKAFFQNQTFQTAPN